MHAGVDVALIGGALCLMIWSLCSLACPDRGDWTPVSLTVTLRCCCAFVLGSQVQPDFMDYTAFKKKFIDVIKAGQQRDATGSQKGQMTRKLSVLQDTTAVSRGQHLPSGFD